MMDVISLIKAEPYYHALAIVESGMNVLAKNNQSTAKGLFQFIDSTAQALGISDPFDPAQAWEGVQKLTSQNAHILGSTAPAKLYAAHYLGAPLARKYLNGEVLSDAERELVQAFDNGPAKRFEKTYADIVGV